VIQSFSHIYLPVRDIDEAIEFYTQKLGFTLLRKYTVNGALAAYVNLNDILLEFSTSQNTPSVDGRSELRIGLIVDDLDATLVDLKAKGVPVPREPWQAMTFWGRQCQIMDPSGYRISLREYRAPDNAHFPDWQPDQEGIVRLA
jgi:catechol 2,3-dioxygenase-like lactoylglutathione lyase family enzyme